MLDQANAKQTTIGAATDKLHMTIDEAYKALSNLEGRISHALFSYAPEEDANSAMSSPTPIQVDAVAPISHASDRLSGLISDINRLIGRIGI